ncbi:MAG: hypothetical protein IT532_09330 [Burkholderiales bacterium]|nr:hypothetical protein [Burkholderiales bacterium]
MELRHGHHRPCCPALLFLGLPALFLIVAILLAPRLFRGMRAVPGRLFGSGPAH